MQSDPVQVLNQPLRPMVKLIFLFLALKYLELNVMNMLYPCVSRNVFGKQKQMSQAGIQNVLNNAIMQQLCTSKIEKYLSITTKWLPVTKVTDNISQHHPLFC